MLDTLFTEVYTKFKLEFYRRIFSRFETREATLTSVETFCVEVIHALNKPTIKEFADFVRISQANAAYKVQSLIKKGYVEKRRSEKDKREYALLTTEKFQNYYDKSAEYVHEVIQRMSERFTVEEIKMLERILTVMTHELMPEVSLEQSGVAASPRI